LKPLTTEQEEAAKLLFSAILKLRSVALRSDATKEIYDLADAIHNLPLIIMEPDKEWEHELVIARHAMSHTN
jgi:hypothetical protein